MALSRRAFLTGTTGLAATAATGGGAAVAGLAGVVSQTDRFGKVFEALGRSGGFPHKSLNSILGVFRDAGAASDAAGIYACIKGHGAFRREHSECGQGKICFSTEKSLFYKLLALPQSVPLMDILSDDVLAALHEPQNVEDEDDLRSFFLCSGMVRKIDPDQLKQLREFIAPLCNYDTTAADLVGSFQGYFRRLASHAINNPADFFSQGFGEIGAFGLGRGPFDKLIKVLESGPGGTQDQLLGDLKDVNEKIIKDYQRDADAFYKRLDEEREAMRVAQRRRAEELLKKRRRYVLRLYPSTEDSFVLKRDIRDAVPTRMDWLHWLQRIDPNNAKPADIELGHLGMTITIKNPKALSVLKAALAEQSNKDVTDLLDISLVVDLPNCRIGQDLNSPHSNVRSSKAAADDPHNAATDSRNMRISTMLLR